MTGLVAILSGIMMSTGFLSTDVNVYQDQIQEQIIREGYITWVTSRDSLVYKSGRILGQRFGKYNTINRTDCSGMFVGYGIYIGLLKSRARYSDGSRVDEGLNSYNIWKLGEHKGYDEIERGDFVFFDNSNVFHIAVAGTGMEGNKLTIIDFIQQLDKRATDRDIHLYKCSGRYPDTRCYTVNGNTYRIYIASNGFVDEMKKKGFVLDETTEALDLLKQKQDELFLAQKLQDYITSLGVDLDGYDGVSIDTLALEYIALL